MIAPHILEREEWEKRLKTERRCAPATIDKDQSGLDGGNEYWVTEHGRLFIVPCDEGGYLRVDDYHLVVVEIEKLRPLDLDT